ncbi:hypothetical protein PV328_011204 [Microctonus aethiopoides]|uniref:Uncharacterized protein n=1 Tax=Microctonus aethiopoides TaxID=144406 RepID=A0AA39C3X8_9HYME|nr:hypothetical protein PV328_011204 [Microctonus aethiopoides]
MDVHNKNKSSGDEAPSGASDPLSQAPSAAETPRFGQTLQSGHSEETVLMDTTGQDGSTPAGPQIPKDGRVAQVYCALVKTLGRCLSGDSGQGEDSKAEENDDPLQRYERRGSSRL